MPVMVREGAWPGFLPGACGPALKFSFLQLIVLPGNAQRNQERLEESCEANIFLRLPLDSKARVRMGCTLLFS